VRRALDLLAVPAGKAVVVGDQIFADILAGNLASVFTILVTPIKPEQEHWFTRIKRPWEKIVLRSFWKKFPDGVWNAESK
jgi:predicted HAD superfamily phosphohydrolase YqeG